MPEYTKRDSIVALRELFHDGMNGAEWTDEYFGNMYNKALNILGMMTISKGQTKGIFNVYMNTLDPKSFVGCEVEDLDQVIEGYHTSLQRNEIYSISGYDIKDLFDLRVFLRDSLLGRIGDYAVANLAFGHNAGRIKGMWYDVKFVNKDTALTVSVKSIDKDNRSVALSPSGVMNIDDRCRAVFADNAVTKKLDWHGFIKSHALARKLNKYMRQRYEDIDNQIYDLYASPDELSLA